MMNTHIKNISRLLTLVLLLTVVQLRAADVKTVNGKVIDKDGFPVVGATVEASNEITATDAKGEFTLKTDGDITVSMLGMNSTTVKTDADRYLTVVLDEDPVEELLSVPYGAIKVSEMVSAVSTIHGDDLSDEYTNGLAPILAGKLSGLTVVRIGDQPGYSDASLYVRGYSEPAAVYVDGFQAPLKNLDPREIETVSVLKDASSLSQFGVDGSNGVIWITTKRGQLSKPRVSVTMDHGWQEAVELSRFASAYDYARLYNEALSNDNGVWTQYYSEEQLNRYKNPGVSPENALLYPDVNWFDEVLKPFAPVTNVNASFSGGSKRLRYYMQVGYQNIDGLYAGTDPKRDINSNANYQNLNYRMNVDSQLSDIFDISVSFSGNIGDTYDTSYGSEKLWKDMMTYPANAFPVMTPEGYGGTTLYANNPKASLLETGYWQYHNRNVQAIARLGQNLDFIAKGLRLTEAVAVYSTQAQYYMKKKSYSRYAPFLNEAGEIDYVVTGIDDSDFSITQSGNSYNDYKYRLNTEVVLSYSRSLGRNNLSASAVYTTDKYTICGTNPSVVTRRLLGNVNYNYDDRYFAQFSLTAGGMSVYAPGANTGLFPSLALGWIVSNEDFMKGGSIVDFLKLRASVGRTGWANLTSANNYYMYQQYYYSSTSPSYLGWNGTTSIPTIYENYKANPDASWEKSLKADVGFDMQMFNKRLTLSVDGFYDKNYDILTSANVFEYTGILSDINYNFGVINRWGTDITLDYTDRIGDFEFYARPKFSFVRSKVIEMNEEPKMYDYQRMTGLPYGARQLLVADGLFQSWDEINDPSTPVYMFGDIQPGDIKYIDQNKDGYIDDNDMVYLEDEYGEMPEINFGISLGASWKGLDFEVTGYGMANRTVMINNRINSAFTDGTGNLSTMALENRWAYYPEQGIDTRETATYPRLSVGSNTNNWRPSTFWLRNGSLFRISNLVLGYTLPNRITSKIAVDKLRIFLDCTNPYLFDTVDNTDVECMTGYPIMRTWKFGVNINF